MNLNDSFADLKSDFPIKIWFDRNRIAVLKILDRNNNKILVYTSTVKKSRWSTNKRYRPRVFSRCPNFLDFIAIKFLFFFFENFHRNGLHENLLKIDSVSSTIKVLLAVPNNQIRPSERIKLRYTYCAYIIIRIYIYIHNSRLVNRIGVNDRYVIFLPSVGSVRADMGTGIK